MNFKPCVEELGQRCLPSATIYNQAPGATWDTVKVEEHWQDGVTIEVANSPQIVNGLYEKASYSEDMLSSHDSQREGILLFTKDGLLFMARDTVCDWYYDPQTNNNQVIVVTTLDTPALLTPAQVTGASVTCTDSGTWLVTWQQGSQIVVDRSTDGINWTPTIVMDTGTVQPVSGADFVAMGTVPLNYNDIVAGAVVNTGPQISSVQVTGADGTVQFKVALDVAWQLPDGTVKAVELQSSDDGLTFDAGHWLALDAVFAQPTTYLTLGQTNGLS